MHKILTVTLAVLLCIVVAFSAYFLVIKKNNSPIIQSTSSNILYLTNPVVSFSGKIDNINGNIITVSQDMVFSQKNKKITYKASVNDKTIFSSPPNFIPYLFKQPTPASGSAIKQLTIRDLKVGQLVMIGTNTDLRSLNSDQFEATSISLLPNITFINGKITAINGGELTVRGVTITPPTAIINTQPPKEKDYIIIVNPNTEISGSSAPSVPYDPNKPPKPEKYALSDLKKDMQITVYSEENAETADKLTAQRIEPLFSNISTITPNLSTQPASTGSQKIK